MYLFTAGVCGHAVVSGLSREFVGLAVHFVTAPISTPIILGMTYSNNNA
jgi:hypothetical protein